MLPPVIDDIDVIEEGMMDIGRGMIAGEDVGACGIPITIDRGVVLTCDLLDSNSLFLELLFVFLVHGLLLLMLLMLVMLLLLLLCGILSGVSLSSHCPAFFVSTLSTRTSYSACLTSTHCSILSLRQSIKTKHKIKY